LVTLAAAAIGATIALVSPILASLFTRSGSTKEAQRAVAKEILDLLSDVRPVEELLGGRHSPARRRLYILGLQLRDTSARESCAELVREADQVALADDALYRAWVQTLTEVSRVYRGQSR
jgi:hypothetical protein